MKKIEIPILKTERLTLEPISKEHSEGMFALWADADVCKCSGVVTDTNGNIIPTPVQKSTQSDLIIDFWLNAIKDGWGFRWAVLLENGFTGTLGFNSITDYYEIAFHLHPDYWGKGIMSEASEVAVKWASNNGATGIEAFIEPENIASQALAQRLNMEATDEYSEGAQRYILSF